MIDCFSQYSSSPSNAKGKTHDKTIIHFSDLMGFLADEDKQLFTKTHKQVLPQISRDYKGLPKHRS
jgi:hypothetical protein